MAGANAGPAERTFLAWLRTSLSFASIGIAVTQLFRLNTSLQSDKDSVDTSDMTLVELLMSSANPQAKMRHVGKPLGATFLGICEFASTVFRRCGANTYHSDTDPTSWVPPLLRKPALCYPRQVPSFTRQHYPGVARRLLADRGVSGGCRSGCTWRLREAIDMMATCLSA